VLRITVTVIFSLKLFTARRTSRNDQAIPMMCEDDGDYYDDDYRVALRR